MKTSISVVIFDLDGTITKPYLDFDMIRQEMGLDRDGGPILELLESMTAPQRHAAEVILARHESQALAASALNPGAAETLQTLKSAGIKVAILTRNKRENALAVAKKHNLSFDAVVGRDDGPVKPDAFGVLHLCEKFGIKPAQAMVVGDYLFDLQCAKAAGATAVLLANQQNWKEFARYADHTVDRIDEILAIIGVEPKHTDAGDGV